MCCSGGIWPGGKLLLCLAVLVLCSAGQRATVQPGCVGSRVTFLALSPLWRCKVLGGWAEGHRINRLNRFYFIQII